MGTVISIAFLINVFESYQKENISSENHCALCAEFEKVFKIF